MAEVIPMTHDFEGKEWDWPMQHDDGVVKMINTDDQFEVHLDCQYFTPKEIEVCIGLGLSAWRKLL